MGSEQTHSLLDALPHMRTELGLWNSETAPELYLKLGILESEFGSTVAHGLFCPRKPETDLRYVPFSSVTISSASLLNSV